jgi:TPR repeat protein
MKQFLLLMLLAMISAPSVSQAKPKKGSIGAENMMPMMAREPTEAERAEMRAKADKEYTELLPLAEKGDQSAQIRLSELQLGNCSCFNRVSSREWLAKAASAGNIQAQGRLGDDLYQGGQGSHIDINEALIWYFKAVELGDLSHATKIGRIYYAGKGPSVNLEKAAMWFQKAAEQGDREAMGYLSGMYLTGKGVPKDETKAFALQMKLAEWHHSCRYVFDGCPQLGLAQMYYFGTGTSKNVEQAAAWYLKAAEADSVDGQLAIGYLFEKGEGVKKSKKKSAYWRSKALKELDEKAEYDAASQLRLGWILQEGTFSPKDYKRAAFLFSKVGKYGSVGLGKMYEEGRYVPQDLEHAALLYRYASEVGIDAAKQLLMDPKFAAIEEFKPAADVSAYPLWIMRADAEQGNAQAQFRMGGFYSEGQLVRANQRIAKGWYELAAAQGHKDAKAALKSMHAKK